MDAGHELKKAVYENLNVPGFVDQVLDRIVDQALENLVKSTENPFDDALKAALYPPLSNELKKLAREQWDALLKPVVPTPALEA